MMRPGSPAAPPPASALPLLLAAVLSCAAPRPPPLAIAWQAALHRDHPLVGEIWDVRARRAVPAAALRAAVARSRFVLLGETHDNPDHHALQAELLQAVVDAGRRPALAIEMLDTDQQPAVDAALAGAATPEALRDAVGWDRSGWPPFAQYRPVFAVGLSARLPVVAANLSRGGAREVVHRGEDALEPPVRLLLERAGPISEAEARARGEEMAASHCGQLPARFVAPMVRSQRARDAQLARAVAAAATPDGAVLVTGAEHARRDRGVPVFLAAAGVPAGELVSVAFREVDPAERTAADEPWPFDYVVFTPAAEREDPCAGMKSLPRGMLPRPRSKAARGPPSATVGHRLLGFASLRRRAEPGSSSARRPSG